MATNIPEGIKLLLKELRPQSQARLVASDEARINEELKKCCDAHPRCRHRGRCHSLHNQVMRFIPYERKEKATPPERKTDGGSWIPQANLRPILRSSRERMVY